MKYERSDRASGSIWSSGVFERASAFAENQEAYVKSEHTGRIWNPGDSDFSASDGAVPVQYPKLAGGWQPVLPYKKVDIAGWAQRYGEEDENLLNFDTYADQFLVDVISEQAFKALQSASKDIKEEMARLYADMNRDYCSGTKIDVAKIRKARHISTGSVTAAMISGWQGCRRSCTMPGRTTRCWS